MPRKLQLPPPPTRWDILYAGKKAKLPGEVEAADAAIAPPRGASMTAF
jgi:hypothetical protein